MLHVSWDWFRSWMYVVIFINYISQLVWYNIFTISGSHNMCIIPAWKVGDRGFEPHSGLQVSKKQNVSSPLTRKNSILWEPLWPIGSVLEFGIMCLEGSVISIISPSLKNVLLAQFSLYVHKWGLKSHLFHFICVLVYHFVYFIYWNACMLSSTSPVIRRWCWVYNSAITEWASVEYQTFMYLHVPQVREQVHLAQLD